MSLQYFQPINTDLFAIENYQEEQLGFQLLQPIELETATIALIGINDQRHQNEANLIRKAIYELYSVSSSQKIIDLGNFDLLEKEQFSYNQLGEAVRELLERSILPIFFGGSPKTMYALQKGFGLAKQYSNVAMIQSTFQFNDAQSDLVTDQNYLYKTCHEEGSYLFNFMQLGYQTYLVNPKALQLQEQLNFDMLRLGRIRDDLKTVEPLLRDLDLLGVSLNAVKFADTGGCKVASPNGLYAEEIAQLMRYAGISDKLKCIGFFDFRANDSIEPKVSAALIAQSIWCFLEGVLQRKREWPDQNDKNFLKYIVHNDEMELDLIYLKSEISGRWWIQMPEDKAMLKKKFYIPCSYDDYQTALQGDIPERWLNGFNKLG